MDKRYRQIIREEINKVLKESRDEKGQYNGHVKKGGQDEYTAKHGKKEQNAMRGQVTKLAKSDAINNAAVARQMKRDHPDMKIDSSYISKMTQNKPGYTSGHYHLDKEKADAYLQATDELGLT